MKFTRERPKETALDRQYLTSVQRVGDGRPGPRTGGGGQKATGAPLHGTWAAAFYHHP